MTKTPGTLVALTACLLLGTGTAAAGNKIYIDSYPNEETCERVAATYRSSDTAAACYWNRGYVQWDLWIWSAGG